MNKAYFFLLLLPLFSFTCKKNEHAGCLEGKVIRTSCASFIVQVLNNDSVGQDGWIDESTGLTYDNVFNVSNKCRLPESLKANSTFRFKLGSDKENNCASCYLYDAPPGLHHMVTLCDSNE